MKDQKLFNLLYLFIAASIMFFNAGCSKDETTAPPVTVNESEVLVQYLESTGGDFI